MNYYIYFLTTQLVSRLSSVSHWFWVDAVGSNSWYCGVWVFSPAVFPAGQACKPYPNGSEHLKTSARMKVLVNKNYLKLALWLQMHSIDPGMVKIIDKMTCYTVKKSAIVSIYNLIIPPFILAIARKQRYCYYFVLTDEPFVLCYWWIFQFSLTFWINHLLS